MGLVNQVFMRNIYANGVTIRSVNNHGRVIRYIRLVRASGVCVEGLDVIVFLYSNVLDEFTVFYLDALRLYFMGLLRSVGGVIYAIGLGDVYLVVPSR